MTDKEFDRFFHLLFPTKEDFLCMYPTCENVAENVSLLRRMGMNIDKGICRIFLNETVSYTGTCKEPKTGCEHFMCDVSLNLQRDESGKMTVFFDGFRYDKFFAKRKEEAEKTKSTEELIKENRKLLELLERMQGKIDSLEKANNHH